MSAVFLTLCIPIVYSIFCLIPPVTIVRPLCFSTLVLFVEQTVLSAANTGNVFLNYNATGKSSLFGGGVFNFTGPEDIRKTIENIERYDKAVDSFPVATKENAVYSSVTTSFSDIYASKHTVDKSSSSRHDGSENIINVDLNRTRFQPSTTYASRNKTDSSSEPSLIEQTVRTMNTPLFEGMTFSKRWRGDLTTAFEFNLESEYKGYISTERYAERTCFTCVWNVTASVTGSQNHVVMITLITKELADCEVQRVDIVTCTKTDTVCSDNPPAVQIYQTHIFHVHWILQYISSYINIFPNAFRLLFSFHKLPTAAILDFTCALLSQQNVTTKKKSSRILQKLPSGLWNCSVSHWPEFKYNFPCNYDTECVSAEDETNCSYTGHCAVGQISAAGRCSCSQCIAMPTAVESYCCQESEPVKQKLEDSLVFAFASILGLNQYV